jgi:nitroreductase
MDVFEAIRERRSIKRFLARPVGRAEIERVLEAAVLAPNHRLTQPWGFVVLGPEAKRRYAETRARLKTGGVEAAGKAEEKRARIIEETLEIPQVIAVTSFVDADPVTREEDYAATWMAIQNLLLAATALGLGTKVVTGDVIGDDEMRAALGVARDHRIVAFIHMGVAAEVPAPKRRIPAAEKTRWLP